MEQVKGKTPLSNDASRWVKMSQLTYVNPMDPQSKERKWEMVERKTTNASGVDAVAVYVELVKADQPHDVDIVLVKQFRPPLDRYTIEMPAGLIDVGESAEEAAVRELREECGLAGIVVGSSPPIYSDAGISASAFCYVMMRVIDGGQPRQPQPDEGEFIEMLTVPRSQFLAKLNEFNQAEDTVVDAKVYSWALGLNAGLSVSREQ